jgi:putative glycosyltransferase (TIGR04348 family)
LNVLIITPAARGTRKGNRVTALRWARHLRALRHRVRVAQEWEGQACDVLVALHARKSAASIARFRENRPGAPLVVALTGTDIYQDFPGSRETERSLELADRLIVLQPLAVELLPAQTRSKARVIFQSATGGLPAPVAPGVFQVCLLAHLREVKDPFLAAQAVRRLPERSRIRLIHLGAALDVEAEIRARSEMATNPRYVWLGEQPRARALSTLAGSRVLLVLSHLEGGANVVSEALASNVPILSTRIPGSVGILGADYAGYFPVGDAAALTALLERVEADKAFMASLTEGIGRVRALVEPARERAAWGALMGELVRT